MNALAIPVAVVLIAVFTATITDIRAFRVHNLLTLPLLVSGLLYHWYIGSADALLNSIYGATFGFLSLFLFFLLGGIGGGDVKLMTGVGAWLGWPLTFWVFLVAALAAGCYSTVLILSNGRVRETWVRLQVIWHRISAVGKHLGSEDRIEAQVKRADCRTRLIPFAAMTFIGVLVITICYRFRLTEAFLSPR